MNFPTLFILILILLLVLTDCIFHLHHQWIRHKLLCDISHVSRLSLWSGVLWKIIYNEHHNANNIFVPINVVSFFYHILSENIFVPLTFQRSWRPTRKPTYFLYMSSGYLCYGRIIGWLRNFCYRSSLKCFELTDLAKKLLTLRFIAMFTKPYHETLPSANFNPVQPLMPFLLTFFSILSYIYV